MYVKNKSIEEKKTCFCCCILYENMFNAKGLCKKNIFVLCI